MCPRHCWIVALVFLQTTVVHSQISTDARRSLRNSSFPEVWIEHTDVAKIYAHPSCNPETFPSDNRPQTLSGQRLNTYFAFWRSSQSATSPLPVAVVITFYSQACAFSKALLPLIEEVAQHYSKQSIKFLRVDIAQLAYSDMIKMGITTTPVIRLHTQVNRLTFNGNRTMAGLTEYITKHTEISTLPWTATVPALFGESQMPYTQAPHRAALASIDDMRSWAVAPLTLLAECIVVLLTIEAIWRQPFIQRRWSAVQNQQQ